MNIKHNIFIKDFKVIENKPNCKANNGIRK